MKSFMKKFILLCGVLIATATAAQAQQTWNCGATTNPGGAASVTATLSASGVMTISGAGAMANFNGASGQPWASVRASITSLIINAGVTSIGNEAFDECSNITGALTIPNSVTSIGSSAFNGCTGFTGALSIPNSVTSIGMYAFYNCNGFNGALTIGNSVTSIGNGAFERCSGFTGALTIPNGVTSIGNYAFYGCSNITGALTIPNGVTSIGNYAFYGCSNITGALTIPNGVTSIGNSTFENCSGLTGALTIPNGVTSIGIYAFYNCSGLTGALTIPAGVTSIGISTFRDCSGLTSVTIPNSVTSIGTNAFYGCSGFTSITGYRATPPTVTNANTFNSVPKTIPLYVPFSAISGYQGATGWSDFTNVQPIVALPTTAAVTFGSTTGSLSVTADAALTSPTYTWYSNAANSSTGGTLIDGATGANFPTTSLAAGAYYIYCEVSTSWGTVATNAAEVNVAKGDYDMSGITFANKTVTYDGQAQSITIGGTLPSGVTVTYAGNGETNAGTYQVTANFATSNSNYNVPSPASKTATLTIEPKSISGATVTVGGAYTYTGAAQTPTAANVSVTLAGFTPTYTSAVTSNTNAGTATVTVTGTDNYSGTETGTFAIGKATYDMSGITFANSTVTQNGAAQSILIGGTLPSGVTVTYTGNGQTAAGVYTVTATFAVSDATNYNVPAAKTATLTITAQVSVLAQDRVIPAVKPSEEAIVIAPVTVLSGEFTAGPNPVSKQSGSVNFFRQGKRVSNSELRIYDATGNVINKVKISDNKTVGSQARRIVGSWDLTDRKGRQVSEGTYLVKGVIRTSDGKSEKVSVILGVR